MYIDENTKGDDTIKYMGSKARLSKDLVPIINNIIKQKQIDTYIEPFVGGANLIDKIKCDNRIGVDYNKYLIAMWQSLQSGWLPHKTSVDISMRILEIIWINMMMHWLL